MQKGPHHHFGKELKRSLKWLESLACVSKITMGSAEGARHAYTPGHMKYQMDTVTGAKLIAYSGNGVVNIFVSLSDRLEFKSKLEERFKS